MPSQLLVVPTAIFYRATFDKPRLTMGIINDEKIQAPIHADNFFELFPFCLFDALGHGDVQKELPVFINHFCRAELPRSVEEVFHPLGFERHLDSFFQGVDGKHALCQRIVTIPDPIQFGLFEFYFRPVVAVFHRAFVSGDHCLGNRLRHLRTKTKLFAQRMVSEGMQTGLNQLF